MIENTGAPGIVKGGITDTQTHEVEAKKSERNSVSKDVAPNRRLEAVAASPLEV